MTQLLTILLVALVGGIIAKYLKLQPILGFIFAGVVSGIALPETTKLSVEKIAEIGLIFLLFSVGLELSLSKLSRVLKIAFFGGGVQILLVTGISFLLLKLMGLDFNSSLVLSFCFSLSSTAIVVKTLIDKGEVETIHGEVMIGWLLIQDLAVIPMMVILTSLGVKGSLLSFGVLNSLLKAMIVIAGVLLLGRLVVPKVLHKISSLNSRELLILAAIALAIGTSFLTSLLGISPALGAFLAGVIISEGQEKLAVFSETRPLRDFFVALFFVSLGFLVNLGLVFENLSSILLLVFLVILVKSLVIFFVNILFDYKGKTAVFVSIGLSQVGEFSFILITLAKSLNMISEKGSVLGISTAIITLLIFPLIYKESLNVWRKIRSLIEKNEFLSKLIMIPVNRKFTSNISFENHVIICGYGRVGSWVGKALDSLNIPFVVIEYNQNIANDLKKSGVQVVYGDPTEPEILEAAAIGRAKTIISAIPDSIAQESLICLSQTVNPKIKIITRAHSNEEREKLKYLRVDKIIQPEFEAAVAMVKSLLVYMGKPKEEIKERIRKLRLSQAMSY